MSDAEPDDADSAASGAEPLLGTRNLTKRFGSLLAVDGVSIAIDRGEVRTIIGPNGAGKTVLFDLLSGFSTPDRGAVIFDGEDVTDLPPHRRVARGMARSFQITSVFDDLTVRENVRLAVQSTAYAGLDGREALFTPTERFAAVTARVEEVLTAVGLGGRADAAAVELAHGQRRLLEVALVLALDPKLVLLDEPTAGMSGDGTRDMMDLIRTAFAHRTLVIVEHDIDVVMEVSDSVTVLHRGSVIEEGPPGVIAESEAVQEAYLGGRG